MALQKIYSSDNSTVYVVQMEQKPKHQTELKIGIYEKKEKYNLVKSDFSP